jgi:hypothetical protein
MKKWKCSQNLKMMMEKKRRKGKTNKNQKSSQNQKINDE